MGSDDEEVLDGKSIDPDGIRVVGYSSDVA